MLIQTTFVSRSLRAMAVGLPGVLVLPFVLVAPAGVPAGALAVGPTLLLAAAAMAGAWAAGRAKMCSWLIGGDELRVGDLCLGAIVGIAVGLALAQIDQALTPIWRGAAIHPLTLIESVTPCAFILGVLYGGLTEEIVFRWGLVSALIVITTRSLPWPIGIAPAVMTAAVLFAFAHLPSAFAGAEGWSSGAVVRTLGWNAMLGVLFGGFFVAKGLETAISAHIGFHCGAAFAAIL